MIHFPHKKNNLFINLDPHMGLWWTIGTPTPPVPAPKYGLHVGVGVLGWAFGDSRDKTKPNILADGTPVVTRGQDVTMLVVPHLNIVPFPPVINVLIPALILGSESKCNFGAMTVLCNGEPLAVSLFTYVGLNMACGDPYMLPSSFCITRSTVHVGMTLADIVCGIVLCIVDAAIAKLLSCIGDKIAQIIPKGFMVGPMKALLGKAGIGKVYHAAKGPLTGLFKGGLRSGAFTSTSTTIIRTIISKGAAQGGNLGLSESGVTNPLTDFISNASETLF